ncbi:MAG: hypothetical protein N3B16_02595, partial [Candidatus Aminicenantes bacterium]|nr:hypothetical protein [Candidatus Aminicenantes bacterium]
MKFTDLRRKDQLLHEVIIVLTLLLVGVTVFLPSLKGDFIWDDNYFIADNQLILDPRFLNKVLFVPFGGPDGFDENSLLLGRAVKFYRPLTSFSYWLDYKIWNLNPAGFHLTNIMINYLSSIILYYTLRRWQMSSLWAFFSSLLFTIFPSHFENVAWISGRTDLLCFLFGSLVFFFISLYFKKNKYFFLLISSFLYLLSLLGKETSLMIPLIFFIAYWWIKKDIFKAFSRSLVFLPSLLIWFFLRNIALGSVDLELKKRTVADFLATLGFYTSRTIFPFKLSLSVESQRVFENKFYLIIGAIFMVMLFYSIVKVYYGWKNWTLISLFLNAYFWLLIPSILIIFLSSTVSFIAWRFLYFPSAVAILGIVTLIT